MWMFFPCTNSLINDGVEESEVIKDYFIIHIYELFYVVQRMIWFNVLIITWICHAVSIGEKHIPTILLKDFFIENEVLLHIIK